MLRSLSPLFICLFIVINIVYWNPHLAYCLSELNLEVATDSTLYSPTSLITIIGNATLNGQSITDGLVGLEILDPDLSPYFFRVLKTGEGTQLGWISIENAYTSDMNGNPKKNFKAGTSVYVTAIIKNTGPKDQNVTLTVSICDSTLQPLGLAFTVCPVPSFISLIFTFAVPLPDWAANGTSTAFVNVFSDLPTKGGFPLCEEKSALFEIQSQNIEAPPQFEKSITSMFEAYIKVPEEVKFGNYTLAYSMSYAGFQASGKVSFKISITGDINGDCRVDYKDLFILAAAYGSKKGDERYNASADLNKDEKVDYKDLFLLAASYGKVLG